MKGTAKRHIDVIIWIVPKNNNLLCDGSMNLLKKAGPDMKQAKHTPADLAVHNNEIAWFPTPT